MISHLLLLVDQQHLNGPWDVEQDLVVLDDICEQIDVKLHSKG